MRIAFSDIQDRNGYLCEIEADWVPRVGDTVVLPPDITYHSGIVIRIIWCYDELTMSGPDVLVILELERR